MAALDNKRMEFVMVSGFLSLVLLSVVFTVSETGRIIRGVFAVIFLFTCVGWFLVRSYPNSRPTLWFVGMLLLSGGGMVPSSLPWITPRVCFGTGFCLIVLYHWRRHEKERKARLERQ
jgi:hypothetical protein